MSPRVDCPVCGARCNAMHLKRDGCWSCKADQDQQRKARNFEIFMDLSEETRWKLLWEAAGQPLL